MFLAASFQVLNHHRAKIYFFVCTPAKKADRMFNKMPAGEWICCGKRKIAEKSCERKQKENEIPTTVQMPFYSRFFVHTMV